MKEKKYILIGCCGMSCSLCPRYHTNGKSKCKGCGTDPHCQYCSTFKCCTVKRNLESCSDCSEVPCERIKNLKDWNGFNTNKIWLKNLHKIKNEGYDSWLNFQLEKKVFLEEALAKYNAGRSKSFIILHFLFFSLASIKKVMNTVRKIDESDIKKRANIFKEILEAEANEQKLEI